MDSYLPRGAESYKMKLKLNRGDDGPLMLSDGEKMMRRKMISEEQQQVLLNDDVDASEPISDEDASYINVMVSWSSSHVERFLHFNFTLSFQKQI